MNLCLLHETEATRPSILPIQPNFEHLDLPTFAEKLINRLLSRTIRQITYMKISPCLQLRQNLTFKEADKVLDCITDIESRGILEAVSVL